MYPWRVKGGRSQVILKLIEWETGLMGQLQRDLDREEENIDECVLV